MTQKGLEPLVLTTNREEAKDCPDRREWDCRGRMMWNSVPAEAAGHAMFLPKQRKTAKRPMQLAGHHDKIAKTV